MTRAWPLGLCAVAAVMVTGCGGGDGPATKPGQATEYFYSAFAERNAKRACDQLQGNLGARAQSDLVFKLTRLQRDADWERPNCREAVANAPSRVRRVAGEVKFNPPGGSGPNANVAVELGGNAKVTVLETGGETWRIAGAQ